MRPEQTMADGLIFLRDTVDGQRRERRIEASKFRGGGYLRGEHAFKITDSGIAVFPRMECLYRAPTGEGTRRSDRLSTGLAQFDKMLRGGYPLGSTTVILGPPGTGKTTLGIHYLSQCTAKQRGLYMSFFEPREQASKKADLLGLPLRKQLDKDWVRYLWFPLTENILDELGHAILAVAGEIDARLIFIDGIGGFGYSTAAPERLLRFLSALVSELRAQERDADDMRVHSSDSSSEIRKPVGAGRSARSGAAS